MTGDFDLPPPDFDSEHLKNLRVLRKSHLSYDASPEERMTYDGMWAWARGRLSCR